MAKQDFEELVFSRKWILHNFHCWIFRTNEFFGNLRGECTKGMYKSHVAPVYTPCPCLVKVDFDLKIPTNLLSFLRLIFSIVHLCMSRNLCIGHENWKFLKPIFGPRPLPPRCEEMVSKKKTRKFWKGSPQLYCITDFLNYWWYVSLDFFIFCGTHRLLRPKNAFRDP